MNINGAIRLFFILVLTTALACSNVSGDAEQGRQLVQQYQCGTCHVIPGANASNGMVAITLESFGLRSYIAGRIPNTDENLARWIVDPPAMIPGTLMPKMGVTPDDARAIAAYLRQLR